MISYINESRIYDNSDLQNNSTESQLSCSSSTSADLSLNQSSLEHQNQAFKISPSIQFDAHIETSSSDSSYLNSEISLKRNHKMDSLSYFSIAAILSTPQLQPNCDNRAVVGRKRKAASSRMNKDTSGSKRLRTIFTQSQLDILEIEFNKQQYMVGNERTYLAESLGLAESQVKIWFQNRRIKWRKCVDDKNKEYHCGDLKSDIANESLNDSYD